MQMFDVNIHCSSLGVCVFTDPHGHAASDYLAVSAILYSSGGEAAAGTDGGGGLLHPHGGQVAPGHVPEGVSAHPPRLPVFLWWVGVDSALHLITQAMSTSFLTSLNTHAFILSTPHA